MMNIPVPALAAELQMDSNTDAFGLQWPGHHGTPMPEGFQHGSASRSMAEE